MRCSRCDRLAVPQAVGRTADGLVVFGWCLSCLDETGCQDVRVARREQLAKAGRRPADPRPARSGSGAAKVSASRSYRSTDPTADRRKLVAAVSFVLSLWGLALFLVGLTLRARMDPSKASPLGNGTPPFFLFGGGAVAAVGVGLWATVSGRALLGSRVGLKAIQVVAFGTALATLIAGILFRSPRRDSLVVALAAGAIAVSVVARRLEDRKFRKPAPWVRE